MKKWIQLFLALVGTFIFFKMIASSLALTETGGKLKEYVESENIDCTPLFYTESREAMEADYSLRKKLEWKKIAK